MKSCFVTLLSSEDYLDGILCLSQSLRAVMSKYKLFCVVCDDIAEFVCPYLRFFDIQFKVVNRLFYLGDNKNRKNRLANTATKIAIYDLDCNENLIYIDGDTFVLKNPDNLFSYPIGSATTIPTNEGIDIAMSSLFSFVPKKSTYRLLCHLLKASYSVLDGELIAAMYNENIHNKNMIFPPSIYHYVISVDRRSPDLTDADVSIVHFLNSPTKPWQMSDEEFEQHWGKHECMKQYKKCLDAVREKKNKLKKLIETSKILIDQEIENINKSLGI